MGLRSDCSVILRFNACLVLLSSMLEANWPWLDRKICGFSRIEIAFRAGREVCPRLIGIALGALCML